MQRVLFSETVFGPIHSRRLGTSLGINLLPDDGKVCSFDCLYCEAGFNAQGTGTTGLPTREEVASKLEEKLSAMRSAGENLDVITFSGNGEPTLHPDFAAVVKDTLDLRDRYFPDVKVSVLTNSSRLDREDVVNALKSIDNNILKLDSAVESTMRVIDRPTSPAFTVDKAIARLKQFGGTGIIQTMMLRGEYNGHRIDNTTEAETDALIEAYRAVRPRSIMIYSIDRKTPAEKLQKVPKDELERIAAKIISRTGITVSIA